ncbi:uncharacterized protein LOC128953712 [Oppia nitens]|uniref:uncharacterized protein LOC128953712 n=1 Tax=Oppia nitens TaxID=1686743 RepID=UPI0023DCB5A3|nr:uncharacterized protein LOC128953712 [Oppia nitens]
MDVPSPARVNQSVQLNCQYELATNEQLYSVKWYGSSGHEFFRYLPRDRPSIKLFPTPGISVNLYQSGPKSVVLESIQPQTSGHYMCEVSVEGPSFATVTAGKDLMVVSAATTAAADTSSGQLNTGDGDDCYHPVISDVCVVTVLLAIYGLFGIL